MKTYKIATLVFLSFSLKASEIGPTVINREIETEVSTQAAAFRLIKNLDLPSLVQVAFINEEIKSGRAEDAAARERIRDEAIRRRQAVEADLRGLHDESQAKINPNDKGRIFYLDSLRSQLSKIPVFGMALDYSGQEAKSYLESEAHRESNADLNRRYSQLTSLLMKKAPTLVSEAQRLSQDKVELRSLYDSLLLAHTGSSLFQSSQQILNDPTQSDFVQHVRLREIYKTFSGARDPVTGGLRTDLSEKSRGELTNDLAKILHADLSRFSDEEKALLKQILEEQRRDRPSEKQLSALLADVEHKNRLGAEESRYRMKRAGAEGLIGIVAIASSALDPEAARALSLIGHSGLEVSDAIRSYQQSLDLPALSTTLSAASLAAFSGAILSTGSKLISALSGGSTEALILAEIRRIHDELRAIKFLIEKNLGRLEHSMERNYLAMLAGFQQLQDKANRSDQKLEEILLRFGHLGMRLNQMESSIESQIRVLADRQNLDRFLDVIKFTRPEKLSYTLSRSLFNKKMDSMADLALYESGAKAYKMMGGLGEAKANTSTLSLADLDTSETSLQLAAEFPKIVESLPYYLSGIDNKMSFAGGMNWDSFFEFLSERFGGQAWSSGRRLPNIEIWAEAVQLYTELGKAWRPYMLSKDRASEIEEMLDAGHRYLRMSEALTRRSDQAYGHNKALFSALFAGFEQQRDVLAQVEKKLTDDFNRDYVDGMPLFEDNFLEVATQTTRDVFQYRADLDVVPCTPNGVSEPSSWGHRQPDFRPESQGWTTAYGGKGGELPVEPFRERLRDLDLVRSVPAEVVALARMSANEKRALRFCYDTIQWVSTGSKTLYFRGDNDTHEKAELLGETPFPSSYKPNQKDAESKWVVVEDQHTGYLQIGVKLQLLAANEIIEIGRFNLKRHFADGKKPYYFYLRKALVAVQRPEAPPPQDPRFSKISNNQFIRTEHGLVGRYETTFKDFATALSSFEAEAFQTNTEGWRSLLVALDAGKSALRSRFFDQLEGAEAHIKARRDLVASAKYLEAVLQFAMPSSIQGDELRPFVFGSRRLSDGLQLAFAKRSEVSGALSKAQELGQSDFIDLRNAVLEKYFATHEDGSLKNPLPLEKNRLVTQTLLKLEAFKSETRQERDEIESAVRQLREEIQRIL